MYELILANFAMHVTLEATEAKSICEKLQHAIIKKNTKLLKEGNVCRNIYFVNNGCLRIFYNDNNGNEHNILFCPENWWTADIASFSKQTRSFYSIDALENTDVFYLSFADLEELYLRVPRLERFFRILSQNGFYLYQERITAGLSKSAEERYRMFQKQYPGLETRIAQKHIAYYIGVTPVFLSMIRRKSLADLNKFS